MSRAGIFRVCEGVAVDMHNRVFKLPSFYGIFLLYIRVFKFPSVFNYFASFF